MAFWGVEVKPGKPYQHRYDEEQGRLRLSQATLGDGSSTKKSILQCNVGDKSPIFLCSLLPNKIETSPLNVEFEEDDEVTFSVIGPSSIHLSGFFYGESENTCGHEDEFGSAGEDIADSDCESDDFDSDSEDEDFEFIDDDMDTLPSSAIRNTGVRIEEIVDDDEANNEKCSKKKVGLIEYNDNNNKNAVTSKTGALVTESEDEDGFPISTPKTEDKLEKSKNSKKKKAKDDSSLTKNGKRKIDAILQDDDKRDIVQASVSSTPNTEDLNQKKKKGKKEKKAQANKVKKDDIQPEEVKNVENEKKLSTEKNLDKNIDSGADESGSKEKKKKNKKKKKQEEKDANTNQSVTNTSVEKEKEEEKASQVRTYPNGLIVEELQMGKPDGKRASPGKTVLVRYIGKLKKNGKIFDSNIGKSPFKFPLGVGRVIKGWDVGVNGMRVGDKRRLTIPPAMGYGATGAGGAIPPNAWLVFDVELVNVN